MAEPVFHVRILTEDGVRFEGEAVSVVAPGELGLLGILAHHAPLLTTIVPGSLTLRTPQQTTTQFTIGGGLLEMFHNQVTVVTDRCATASAATLHPAR